MDIFYEQFNGKDYGETQKIFNLITNGLLLLTTFYIFGVGAMVNAILVFIGYFIMVLVGRKKFVEYEYEITVNELVITKIMNRKRRKIIANINVENIQDVTKIPKKDITCKIETACIKAESNEEQFIYLRNSGDMKVINVVMDDKLISMCRKVNPLVFNKI